MSLEPLPNPKKLSYSGLKLQVRELAKRMNLLTQMEAKTIESTGAPAFVFSEELARLDVPSVAEVVASLTELKEDVAECVANTAELQDELDVIDGLITPPIDDENPAGSGSWSRSVTSQYFSSSARPDNDQGPATMDTFLSIWYDAGTGMFVHKREAEPIEDLTDPPATWPDTQVSWRTRRPDGVILNLGGITQGDTVYVNRTKGVMIDGTYTVEAARLNIRYYDVGGSFDEGFAQVGSFTVTGTGIGDNQYTSEIITDQDGNIIPPS